MGSIRFEQVRKTYPDGTTAVIALDLDIAEGELVALVGPSGCGKTTALRLIAGLEEVTAGDILIDGKRVNDMPPGDRDVAMVFQNYALYPHMSVARNIAFGLRARGASRQEQEAKVLEISRVLSLEDHLHKKPRMLSGGQRQRVAMGRAIVRDPRAFLMDEPLSNLDARLRVQMRGEIVRIQRQLMTTMVYVTHDQVEAMTMGDRVAVMDAGELQQYDTPLRLYTFPANMFVARFLGSPPMNLLPATVTRRRDSTLMCSVAHSEFPLSPEHLSVFPALEGYVGRNVALGVRPEAVSLTTGPEPDALVLQGVVLLVEVLGSELLAHMQVDAGAGAPDLADEHGDATSYRLSARLDPSVSVAADTRVAVRIDTRRVAFFDVEDGRTLRADDGGADGI